MPGSPSTSTTRGAAGLVQRGQHLAQLGVPSHQPGPGRRRPRQGVVAGPSLAPRRRQRHDRDLAGGARAAAGARSSAGSWLRMAVSSSTSGRPGSMPSWS